jgi:periplasmic protein TonB
VFSGLATIRLAKLRAPKDSGHSVGSADSKSVWCANDRWVVYTDKRRCDSWKATAFTTKAQAQREHQRLKQQASTASTPGCKNPRPVAGNPKPVYPRLAIRQGLEGEVSLAVKVSASGKVADISVSKPSGSRLLDQAALEAVRQWTFTAAVCSGVPKSSVTTIPVQFSLLSRPDEASTASTSSKVWCATEFGFWGTSRRSACGTGAEILSSRLQAQVAYKRLKKQTSTASAQRERNEQEAVSAFGALAWAIQQRVSSNWSEPGDFSGMSVAFLVKVDRDGNVISATITKKSGDARLDESAENAIFKASPLPFPTEPRYYEYLKEFNFVFKP